MPFPGVGVVGWQMAMVILAARQAGKARPPERAHNKYWRTIALTGLCTTL